MSSQVEIISGLEIKIKIEISPSDVQTKFVQSFLSIQKNATLKGFRKGKAPLHLIAKAYKEIISSEVVEELVERKLWHTLQERNISPVHQPNINIETMDFEENGKGIIFYATFERLPEIKEIQLNKLKVKEEKLIVDDTKVQQFIDYILDLNSEEVPVLENRPAQIDDTVGLDVSLFLDENNNELYQKMPDLKCTLGRNTMIQGFEEGILGQMVGENRILKLKFPDSYHDPKLSNKDATFEIHLKSISKTIKAELNENFIKKNQAYKTIEEFKTAAKLIVEQQEKERIRKDLINNISKALVELNPIEAPKYLIEQQSRNIISEIKDNLSQEEVQAFLEKSKESIYKKAIFMVQFEILSAFIIDKENLYCTDSEFEERIRDLSKEQGAHKIKKIYSEESSIEDLKHQISKEKFLDFIIKQVAI